MPLSQTAQYTLRAMAVLANLEAGESLPAAQLSDRTGIPVHYLSKIMRRLVLEKLVVSRKGHGGGFALNKPARSITFAQLLAAVDVQMGRNQCAFGWGECDANNACPLHETYSKLSGAVNDWLELTTLADVR